MFDNTVCYRSNSGLVLLYILTYSVTNIIIFMIMYLFLCIYFMFV